MKFSKSCLIIAGEKSGEEHALSFLPNLIQENPHVNFFGVGGGEFEKLNVELIYHIRDFSGIGFSEIIKKIPFYLNAMEKITQEVVSRNCKTAILIDFQGFNLKLAKKLKYLGVKVLYYVAPQAWIWKPWRTKALERNVHTLFTILPFEKEWFSKRGVTNIKSVPHPLIKKLSPHLKNIPARNPIISSKKIKVLFLPGSRNTEVASLLPIFEKLIKQLKEKYDIESTCITVDSVNESLYQLAKFDHLLGNTYLENEINSSDLCVAASGTVTLMTGILQLPTVVIYKVSLISEFIFRNFVKYTGPISLPNIIIGKEVFPELTQASASAENILNQLKIWIESPKEYTHTITSLKQLSDLLAIEDINVSKYLSEVINQ
jgi:lipid-A-disaccharide synthase